MVGVFLVFDLFYFIFFEGFLIPIFEALEKKKFVLLFIYLFIFTFAESVSFSFVILFFISVNWDNQLFCFILNTKLSLSVQK